MSEEYFGEGSLKNLEFILNKHAPKNIFLVTGKKSFAECGAEQTLKNLLLGYNITQFNDFHPNPQLHDIEKGIHLFRTQAPDITVAVGGGSVIDTAKIINILSENEGSPIDYIQKKNLIRQQGKPFVAIPTTSGSGSEATHFAAFYIDKTKYSLADQRMLPVYAIIDPELTFRLPAHITASTGMDALSQAIESYWNVYSTEESKLYAEEAIQLIMKNVVHAVHAVRYARTAMSKGAHLAGKAINITKTTACHAVSYPITAFFNIPHGHAVVLTLPSMLLYNCAVGPDDVADKRGVAYVKKTMNELAQLLGTENCSQAKEHIERLIDAVGLERSFQKLNIQKKRDIDIIVRNGFAPERVLNNPRVLTENALRKILERIS